jgi:plastocyanin
MSTLRRGFRRATSPLACLAVALAFVACSKDSDHGAAEQVGAPEVPAAPAAGRMGTAKIFGRVRFQGAAPEPSMIRMSADPYCAKVNEDAPQSATMRVGADGALPDVFVYVSQGLDQGVYAPPSSPVVLDQIKCAYDPKVFGIQVGQPLEIRNDDQTLHNVHAMPRKSDGFNIGMPMKGMTVVRKFTAPEVLVRIKCDVHPWMAAFAGVVAHPFYAVTGGDGSYEIDGLPAGEYSVEAVHYGLGGLVHRVELADGGTATADFSFSD